MVRAQFNGFSKENLTCHMIPLQANLIVVKRGCGSHECGVMKRTIG